MSQRQITPDDIASSTRGLGLGLASKRELERKIKQHSHSDLFASKVITAACREQLANRFGVK